MSAILIQASQFLLSLSILIIAHELGHYFFARLFGIRCEKFYLFFNPSFTILRFKKTLSGWKVKFFSKNSEPLTSAEYDNKEKTEWGIGWLPLGGYVKISGMIDESLDTDQMKREPQDWEFRSKPAWQRLLVMIGGVSVNFIFALAIYSAILFSWGNAYMEMRDTPMQFSETAQKLGFRDGDRIISADGKILGRFSEKTLFAVLEAKTVNVLRNDAEIALQMPEGGLIRLAMQKKEAPMSPYLPAVIDSVMSDAPAARLLQKGDRFLMVENDTINSFVDLRKFLNENKKTNISAVLLRNNDTISLTIPLTESGLIGFTPQIFMHRESFGFWQSIPAGINYGVNKLISYVRQMKYAFTKEGAENIGGFVTIGGLFAPVWNWQAFWEMTAFLSIILAFMNILPIPALDGGHIMFLLYEVITRRKPSTEFMIKAQTIGMLLLLTLLIYANGNDLIRIFN